MCVTAKLPGHGRGRDEDFSSPPHIYGPAARCKWNFRMGMRSASIYPAGMLVVDMTASLCIEGFRAWVTDDRARLEKCNCDFGGCENAEVNPHYRIKRALLARPRAP